MLFPPHLSENCRRGWEGKHAGGWCDTLVCLLRAKERKRSASSLGTDVAAVNVPLVTARLLQTQEEVFGRI